MAVDAEALAWSMTQSDVLGPTGDGRSGVRLPIHSPSSIGDGGSLCTVVVSLAQSPDAALRLLDSVATGLSLADTPQPPTDAFEPAAGALPHPPLGAVEDVLSSQPPVVLLGAPVALPHPLEVSAREAVLLVVLPQPADVPELPAAELSHPPEALGTADVLDVSPPQPPADAAELVASGPPHPLAFLLLLLVPDVALPQLAVLGSAPHEAAGTLEA